MTSTELVQRQRDLVAFAQDPNFVAEIADALPENIPVHRFKRAMLTALLEKPDVINADRASLYRAILKSAQDGLIPDGREAAIAVFGNQAAYMPMVGGLRKVMAEHGWSLRTAVIYEADEFSYDEAAVELIHRPPRPGVDRGKPEGAYALAVHNDGRRREAVVYDAAKINYIREKSARSKAIWETWPDQMWEKTPAHRLFKKLPLDPADKRIASIIDSLDGSSIEALYGPEDRSARRLVSSRAGAAEAEGGQATVRPVSPTPPDDTDLNEPSDDELDAMATADGEVIEDGQIVMADEPEDDGPVFSTAKGESKFEGKTILQVYESGPRGLAYLKWALKGWPHEPIKSALAAFAETHPDVKEGS